MVYSSLCEHTRFWWLAGSLLNASFHVPFTDQRQRATSCAAAAVIRPLVLARSLWLSFFQKFVLLVSAWISLARSLFAGTSL